MQEKVQKNSGWSPKETGRGCAEQRSFFAAGRGWGIGESFPAWTLSTAVAERLVYQLHLGQEAEGQSNEKSQDFLQHPSSDYFFGSL